VILLTAIFLGATKPAQADVIKTVGEDIISPWTTDALTPFLVGTGLTLSLYVLRAQISDPIQESITTHRPLNSLAPFGNWMGDIYPPLIYCGYALVSGLFGNDRGYLRAEEMGLATAYSGGFTAIGKKVFREARPNSPSGSDKAAMPSGQATTAFTFAGIIGAEHPWYIGVPAYGLAVLDGYARINDNKHYFHDIVAGATVGISYALGVYYKRRDRAWKLEAEKESPWPAFSILPARGLDGVVVGAAKRF
jgi:membrane-associated phospholipid phosphatase